MKKKIIILMLAVMICATSILTACGASFSKVNVSKEFKQDTSYIVTSNGGNAVQYGDMIYFINGSKGYDTTTGNKWGGVDKGALYKAKLHGEKNTETRQFISKNDPSGTGLEFYSTKDYPYMGNEEPDETTEKVDIVNVERIVPKVIGTSGYSKGGVYIYDNYIYYATPNNTKNKAGVVQVTKTDFMRTKVDGSKTQLIYTTGGDATDKPYAFYKQGNSVYLVCSFANSGNKTTIVSVQVTGDKKPAKPVTVTKDATSVLFPSKDMYDSQNNITNSPEDFIYFTRAITSDDRIRTGNVVEMCRPTGKESINLFMTGKEITLEAVSGGALFYREPDNLGGISLKFNNLHDALYGVSYAEKNDGTMVETIAGSKSYRDYENLLEADKKRTQINGTVISSEDLSKFTAVHCFRDNIYANAAHAIAFSSSEVWRFSNGASNMQILDSGAEFHFMEGSDIYFTLSGGAILYKTNINLTVAEKGDRKLIQVSHTDMVSSGFLSDMVAGYVMYFAYVDEWADGYAYFKSIRREGAEEVLVYKRSSSDEAPEEDDEEDDSEEAAATE